MKPVGSTITWRTLNGVRTGKIKEIIEGTKIVKITTPTKAYLVELADGRNVIVEKTASYNMIKPEKLIMTVAEISGFRYGEIIGSDRTRPLPFCRMLIADYYINEGMSTESIGKILHKHHSSIMHYKKILPTWKEQLIRSEKVILTRFEEVLPILAQEALKEEEEELRKKRKQYALKQERQENTPTKSCGIRFREELGLLYALGDMLDSEFRTIHKLSTDYELESSLSHAMKTLERGTKLFHVELSKTSDKQRTATSLRADAYMAILRLILDRVSDSKMLLDIYELIESTFPSFHGADLTDSKDDGFGIIIKDLEHAGETKM